MVTRGMIVTDTAAAQPSEPSIGADALKVLVGKEVGVSDWIKVDQAMIDTFADVTGDHQFIHVDAARAKAETPFGGTIAHGFLVLSLQLLKIIKLGYWLAFLHRGEFRSWLFVPVEIDVAHVRR